jgi:hypothetical protein
MGLPQEPIALTPGQVDAINRNLAEMRHNVNNSLSLITAATEIISRKPEMAPRLLSNLAIQPQRIIDEIRKFSAEFEKMLGITREP